jgi:pimeloyl-ACP methyl ester carboxylesterase
MPATASTSMQRRAPASSRAAGVVMAVLLAAPCLAQAPIRKETLVTTTTTPAPRSARSPSAPADAVRPFEIHVPEEALADLRKRLTATRWPDRETVNDRSQDVRLAELQELVRYWEKDYDWRNPTAYGGRAEDAFDVVIPSMPGYGFSGKPTSTGWGPERMGRARDVLMNRLGYKRYVSQGGDWGSVVADAMGRQAPAGLLGIHVNMPATVPPDVAKALKNGDPAPAGLSEMEKAAFESMNRLYTKGAGYAWMMVTRPQTLAYGLSDSPAGLAAFFYDKFNDWTYSGGDAEKVLTRDEMLDDITLYWLTNTAGSSAQLYWENNNNFNAVEQKTADIAVPVAVTVFPGEIYQAPRSWAERAYPKLIYFNEVNKGGHFAAWEEPELFARELRAGFKSLR